MIPLVPNHVLQEQNRVIVVQVHLLTQLEPTFHRIAHGLSALLEHLGDVTHIALFRPLFLGQTSSNLRCILEHEDQPNEVNVREHLRDGRAIQRGSSLESARWDGAKQVQQDRVVAIPRIEQRLEQILVRVVLLLFLASSSGRG